MSGPEGEVRPEMYLPFRQHDVGQGTVSGDVVVRFSASSAVAGAAVADALKTFTRTGQPPAPRNLDEQFRIRTAGRRFNAGLMSAFGALALLMAAAGVYGLTSFIVEQQTRAIGVRIAIGATARRIFRDVLTDIGRMILAGIALGLFGGWAASRLLSSAMFGVTGAEWWLYGLVVGTLAAVGLLASLLPARRASRVDPLVALRTE
jgi:putative ABC transport system permease protein